MKEPNQQKRLAAILGFVRDGTLGDGLRCDISSDANVDVCFSTWYLKETVVCVRSYFCDSGSVVARNEIRRRFRHRSINQSITLLLCQLDLAYIYVN